MLNCRTLIRQASRLTQPIELLIEDANYWGRHGVPAFHLEAHQVTTGAFLASTKFYPLGESHLQILTVDQRLAYWGRSGENYIHLIYLIEVSSPWNINGWELHEGMAIIMGDAVEMLGSIPSGMRWCSLVIERTKLSSTAIPFLPLDQVRVFHTTPAARDGYVHLVEEISLNYSRLSKTSDSEKERFLSKLENQLVSLYHGMLGRELSLKLTRREENKLVLIRKAIAAMMSYPMDQLRVSHLCEACGACATTITVAFQDMWGMGAIHFLLALRLSGAKRELLTNQNPPASVTDVAISWGFWHFGRFAQYYKRQFGEIPSVTQKRGASGQVQLSKLQAHSHELPARTRKHSF